MPDHYRTLIQSLMQLGFLFSRLGERKQEVWRNRQADKEVMFDRREVAASRDAAEDVVKRAKAAKPGVRATGTPAASLGRSLDPPARAASGSPARPTAARSKASPAKSTAAARKGRPGTAKAGPRRRSR